MSEKYHSKIFITMQELMEQLDISDKTLYRMIQEGELPDFSYGSRSSWCRKKGWHAAVLERHAMDKYERSQSLRNANIPTKINPENEIIFSPRRTRRQETDTDREDSKKQSQTDKKKSSRRKPAYFYSRIAAGFVPSST